MSRKEQREYRLETLSVHEGVYKDTAYNSVTTPIYPSSTFAFERIGQHKGYDYTRSGNPTRQALADNLAALEGGTGAWVTCTGMATFTTLGYLFKAGDHIVTGKDIYSGTIRFLNTVLPTHGVETSFVNMGDPDEVRKAIRPNTKAVLIETPSNPLLNIVDIAAITAVAREHGLLSIADNTFMSPYFQRPFEFGVDIVVHSTTKYLNGHSDVVGGAIITRDAKLGERIAFLVNALGTACSPFDAWLVLRGVKTLAYRMEAHQRNAMAVARFLADHPKVKKVYYPGLETHPGHALAKKQMRGFGGMVSFDADLDKVNLDEFFARLELFSLAESLGGVESLIEQPWTMSHSSISEQARTEGGISPSTVRMSLGIEHPDDLVADLRAALG
ncbi:MAG TPA: PLP-dependent aspartate aminotransferase family protein [Phycisphaerae bacterium]|nr:PLP-dependent aspartate aminotransferase family protein [Phycisphaerae bacterium]HPP25831.1 PLP-dependent aspartate aminotransferase family protein [Phycisphaerae bacterium]HPU26397.1 PLP-dependent aspartate aminotransferase family protein [Phycisphaerae bacterium]